MEHAFETGLVDRDALHVEHEIRVGLNARRGLFAVAEVCRNSDAPLASNLDAFDSDVPAFDDFAGAELECKGLALLVRCEGCVREVGLPSYD